MSCRRTVLPFALVAACLLSGRPTAAQVTTGALSGTITDQSGAVLPGASVEAIHVPTGTRYSAVSGTDGRYLILNVRAGGPYSVTVTMSGFKAETQQGLQVALGEERSVPFRLSLESVTESIEVVGQSSIINPANTGPTSNVSQETIDKLPTIGRGLDDFARLNPYFASVAIGGTLTNSISVAGRNNRYNNIEIDGAVNNDLFGLAANGAPGGQADTQPIALDAIQEVQLLVAPYDVRQGGFSGGGVNVITKSGTNDYAGTAYWFTRNQAFVGDGPQNRPFGDFKDNQFGASFGGPIQKDKAFFFANAELQRRNVPNGFAVGGSTGQDFGHAADAARFRSILQNTYGYDPGDPTQEFEKQTRNNKIFARVDFNLSPTQRLTIRNNYIDGVNDLYGTSNSSTLFNFPDHPYQFNSKTNSTVAQLDSTFGATMANEVRLTYQRIRESRGHDTNFPQVTVRLPDGTSMVAGTEQFSAANALDQDIVELTDDFTINKGAHSITIGTHNEFFKFRNLFIRDNFGTYQFSSLDNLQAGIAQQYDYSFSVTSDPQLAAKFKINQIGFYAGDMWHVAPHFTLTYGARLEKPFFPDKPTANPASVAAFGFATDVAPAPTMFSPRAGFNWDVTGTGKRQVRGGLGIFSGRTPYVWLSNQYGNTGIEFQRIGASFNTANKVPFVADPNAQPRVVTGASAGSFTNEVDLVDPNYTFPKVFRGNLAYDHDLGVFGLVGTVEFLGSKTLEDIDYSNLNRVPSGQTLFDGRPIFTRLVPALSDAVFLTNTTKGSQWSLSGKLERPFRDGFFVSASYIYGRAKSVNDGTSSQALSNWRFVYVPGDINNPPLADSNFDVRHRVNIAASYELKLLRQLHPVVSLFYNGQSGLPYSVLFNTDVNADGTIGNDLLFVPRNVSDVVVTGGTPQQLDDFINGDNGLSQHRGEIAPRNSSRLPWTNRLDFRLALDAPWGKRKLEVTMDVLNILNLLDSSWGTFQFTPNQDIAPIQYGGLDKATGKPIYNIATLASPTFSKFTIDDLRSRWQAQLGFRVRF